MKNRNFFETFFQKVHKTWNFDSKTHLTEGVVDFLGVKLRPTLFDSLSLNESGVEADSEDLEGRDIAIERVERSRT